MIVFFLVGYVLFSVAWLLISMELVSLQPIDPFLVLGNIAVVFVLLFLSAVFWATTRRQPNVEMRFSEGSGGSRRRIVVK